MDTNQFIIDVQYEELWDIYNKKCCVKERGKLKRNISRRVMKDACVSE
jgi:hypothetical protein